MADNVQEFTNDNFESEVLKAEQPVLVDFWAPWCGPCRAIAPTVDAIADEFEGRVRVGKVNTDDNQETAASYGISSIPTLILFKGGEPVEKLVGGGVTQEKLSATLSGHTA